MRVILSLRLWHPCVPGKPQLWGQPTCHCAPFSRAAYWAGYLVVGAATWMSVSGGKRLQSGHLFKQPEDKDKDNVQAAAGAAAVDGGGMPDAPMAKFGAISNIR